MNASTTNTAPTSMIDDLRQSTGIFEVTANLPAMTKKAQKTTNAINNERGTKGKFEHELLPRGIIKQMNKWANASRYLRRAHGVYVGDQFLVSLSKQDKIEQDVEQQRIQMVKMIDYVEQHWAVVENFVQQTLGGLDDADMLIYGTPQGFDIWKAGFGLEAVIRTLPPSGINMIPTALAAKHQQQALEHIKVQEQQYHLSMVNTITMELEDLKQRFETRAAWFAAGGVPADEPTPKISAKFVRGIDDRIQSVGVVAAGLIPEIQKSVNSWTSVSSALLDNIAVIDQQQYCEQLAVALGKIVDGAKGVT